MSVKHAETIVESGTEVSSRSTSSRNPRRTPARRRTARRRSKPMRRASPRRAFCKIWSSNRNCDRTATGFYSVTIGEGRRLAQLLRVKRKEIKKTEPIRCIVDTANDPHEISLDENVTRRSWANRLPSPMVTE